MATDMIDVQTAKKSKRYVTKHGLVSRPQQWGLTFSASRSEFVRATGTGVWGYGSAPHTPRNGSGLVPSARTRRGSDHKGGVTPDLYRVDQQYQRIHERHGDIEGKRIHETASAMLPE